MVDKERINLGFLKQFRDTSTPADLPALQFLLRGKVIDVQIDQADLLLVYEGGRILKLQACGWEAEFISVEEITVPIETVKETL